VDGDTIIAFIELPLGIWARRRIRLKGFFAHEHKGRNPGAAQAAQERLQMALDGQEPHIQTQGMREDRYGRIAATLWLAGKPVDGSQILGPLQLTETDHRADLGAAKAGAHAPGPL
jgi:endonuclease YncB( thermonuclease family)